jgi:hypothetical protein
VTTSNAVVRHAPGQQFPQVGLIPAGTPLAVEICFDRGAYCAVDWAGEAGFVAGELMAIEGTGETVRDVEGAKWARLEAAPTSRLGAFKPILVPELRTEGDSYMGGACSYSITTELKAVLGRGVVSTAVGGSEMGEARDRVLSAENRNLLGHVTVFWDGSQNGITTVDDYADELAAAIDVLGHDHFIIIPAAVPSGTKDAAQQLAIQAEFKRRWPDNILDWRDVLPNTAGIIDADQMCDAVHLNRTALNTMARGIAGFITAEGW